MEIEAATLDDLPPLAPVLARTARQQDDTAATLARRHAGLRLLFESPQPGTVLVARADDGLPAMVMLVHTASLSATGGAKKRRDSRTASATTPAGTPASG